MAVENKERRNLPTIQIIKVLYKKSRTSTLKSNAVNRLTEKNSKKITSALCVPKTYESIHYKMIKKKCKKKNHLSSGCIAFFLEHNWEFECNNSSRFIIN